jgi:hypothetical protein
MVIAAGWYFVSLNEPKAVPVVTPAPATPATTTEAATTNEIATSTNTVPTVPDEIELNLSKLQGKDRLYTEEEGKYENLSEEERKMVNSLFCSGDYQFPQVCDRLKVFDPAYTKSVRLISLDEQVAVITGPHTGVNEEIYIYNAKDQKILTSYQDYWNTAYGTSHMIRYESNKPLKLYRPGMTDFVKIPESTLSSDLSYLKWDNVTGSLPVEFDGEIIMLNVYRHDCDYSVVSEHSGAPVYCENVLTSTKTFDLSNLP